MTEGWCGDDYVVLYSDSECQSASERYGINTLLPGFSIVGLVGWNDFIVHDSNGEVFTVPTVPFDSEHLTPYQIPHTAVLVPDARFSGRIKFYAKPIILGGDPNSGWKFRQKALVLLHLDETGPDVVLLQLGNVGHITKARIRISGDAAGTTNRSTYSAVSDFKSAGEARKQIA